MSQKRCTFLLVLAVFCTFCVVPVIADTSTTYWAPWVTMTNTSSATINWHGGSTESGIIGYATSSYYNQYQNFNNTIAYPENGSYQHVQLTGLEPNTSYTYRVMPSGKPAVFDNRTFRTMPVSGPFTFIVISDSQEGHNYTEWMRFKYVADAVAKEPDVLFILNGGDYAGHDSPDLWNTYFQVADGMLANSAIFPTIGNHEYHNGGDGNSPTNAVQYHSSYALPLNYSFDCAGVRFIILDSPDPNNTDSDDPHTSLALAMSQESWLEDLLDNTLSGTFTMHHHPIWDHYNATPDQNLQPWETLYHTYNISANFAGHTHNYQRYSVGGIPYFIIGDAGGRCADLNDTDPYPVWYQTGETRVLGYLKVVVDPEHNTATAQEIVAASVMEDDSNETPQVYDPPVVIDTITFPLKTNLSPPEPPVPITAPAVISTPGHYRLTNDLVNSTAGTAILIQASDVVLEGNGHVLEGNGSENTTGILIRGGSAGGSNVSVRGLTLSGWHTGIDIQNQAGGNIAACTATRNVFGIYVNSSHRITLEGINASGNIPQNGGGGTGITLYHSPSCTVTGSTLSQNGWEDPLDVGGFGILLDSSPGTVIRSCTISGNRNTAVEDRSAPADLLLTRNTISGNGGNGAIFLGTLHSSRSQNCTISENNLSGNGMGIGLDQADNAVLDRNEVTGGGVGIVLDSSRNATLTGNTMAGNRFNIRVTGTDEQYYWHVIGTSNTVNGKPVYYLFHQAGAIIDAASRAGTVYGIGSPGIVIRDLTLTNSSSGIHLLNSDGALIRNVTARGNEIGIAITGCEGVSVKRSTASANYLAGFEVQDSVDVTLTGITANENIHPLPDTGSGISLDGSRNVSIVDSTAGVNKYAGIVVSGSDQTTVSRVTTAGNGKAGIVISGDGTDVTGCRIADNGDAGIGLIDAHGSRIVNNWFSNTMNIYIGEDVAGTTWNIPKTPGTNIVTGPFLGGNYWAKPDGTGWSQVTSDRGDGFCNASFVIDANNTDSLPLHIPKGSPLYADFTASPFSGQAPLAVQFTDMSTGTPLYRQWNFGDSPVTYDGTNPVHVYERSGTFSVSLWLMDFNGTSTAVKPGYITVVAKPKADFLTNATSGFLPLTVQFTDTSTESPTGWLWDFGDNSTSAGQNPVHTYTKEGTFTVRLTASNAAGTGSMTKTGYIVVPIVHAFMSGTGFHFSLLPA
jgi:parallel beta-helix repeat protein